MIRANDYVKLTKGYLRNLSYYRIAVVNMTDDIKEMAESLSDVSTKIASYEQTAGGNSELNAVEAETARRAEQSIRYKEHAHALRKLQLQIKKLERCIAELPDEEREAIRLFYMERLNYDDITEYLHISHSTCKRRINRATKAIAVMLFGDRADKPVQFAS